MSAPTVSHLLSRISGSLLMAGLSIALFLFVPLQSAAAVDSSLLTILSPLPYQVCQREGFVPQFAHPNQPGGPARGFADVTIRFQVPEDTPWDNAAVAEYRTVLHEGASGRAIDWAPLQIRPVPELDRAFAAVIRVDAGGWYQLEIRISKGGAPLATGLVASFGVGEVFLVAGQSYATNTNDESLTVLDPLRRVSAFHHATSQWQIANDPQPAGDGSSGGSLWPAFGDLLLPSLQVPIGLANVAVGGTSSTQWQPDGQLHARLITAGKTLGRFRAVLWQQGESDVIEKTTTAAYVQNVAAIRQSAVEAWGFQPPWLLAKSTLHPTVYNDSAGESRIRTAIDQLWQVPGFLPGPDTDLLDGPNRGDAQSRRHFSGIGQRNAAALWFAAVLPVVNQLRPEHELVLHQLPDLHLLEPVWSSDHVHRESSILLQDVDSGPIIARLAFVADQITRVTSADQQHVFQEGVDYTIGDDRKTLVFRPNGPIAPLSAADLYPPKDAPHGYRHRAGNPEQNLLYRPGRWFHDHNIEVSYVRHPDTDYAAAAAAGQLPKTTARLQAGLPLRIGISGDSISTGLDASGLSSAAPFQPGYPNLVAAQLQAHFHCDISLMNRAVSGWSIANGNQDLDKLLETRPDLIVVAYGMNDVGRRDPAWFAEQTRLLIGRIREFDEAIEMILVAPMLGNSEWIHTPRDMFARYRDELRSLTGPGIALADLTDVWTVLLQNKHDLDLTGNGLNHPNDFGHRLYAQAILSLLVQPSAQAQ